jgi:signal transduction histidine kinase
VTAQLDAERLAVLVHEVRSPVAALSAIAETLSDGELDAGTRRELLRLVLLACRGIERIVADLAVASIRRERLDAGRLVRDVVAGAALRGTQVELTVPVELPAVEADASRLRQALDNLISNAVVHGGRDASVAVRMRADTMMRIDVSDTGPGIAPEELERIFDAGVRLDRATAPGSGLGLALARAIAEGHGGTLTVVSAPGAGTTFTLALPLSTT